MRHITKIRFDSRQWDGRTSTISSHKIWSWTVNAKRAGSLFDLCITVQQSAAQSHLTVFKRACHKLPQTSGQWKTIQGLFNMLTVQKSIQYFLMLEIIFFIDPFIWPHYSSRFENKIMSLSILKLSLGSLFYFLILQLFQVNEALH